MWGEFKYLFKLKRKTWGSVILSRNTVRHSEQINEQMSDVQDTDTIKH